MIAEMVPRRPYIEQHAIRRTLINVVACCLGNHLTVKAADILVEPGVPFAFVTG